MKTIRTQKNALFYAFFYLLLFGMSYSVSSQCPTVNNSTPATICEDGAGLTYDALTTLLVGDGDISTNGTTIRWYTSLIGGTPFSSNELVNREGAFYIDNNDDLVDCSRELINISFELSATNSEFEEFYCSDENPTVQTFIDDALQAFIPSGGGLVTVYNDFITNDIALPAQAITSTTSFEIIFEDVGGCRSQLEYGLAIYIEKPDAPLIPSPQSFCNTGGNVFTVEDLDIGTATNIEWYNSSDVSGSNLSSTTVINNGDVLFALVSTSPFPCDSETTQVEIIIDEPLNPGTPGNAEFCDDNILVGDLDLFTYLGGADTGGTWSGPTPITANPQGTTNISALVAGIYNYIYTVPTNGTCPEDTSSVTITIYETYTSGTTLSPASFCEVSLPTSFDLFTLIEDYDPDGQWTEGTTSGGTVIVDPVNLSLTTYTPATYNFTYTQNLSPNPCLEESTMVQVIVISDPNAGIANNQTFCENELATVSPFDLFDALTAPYDSGGTWTDSGSAMVLNNIDITSFTITGSPYEYTYTVDNGTCTDDETISITILPAPESGTANTPVEFCEGAASTSFDLYSLITVESGTGVWTNNNTSTVVASPENLDLSGFTTDTYNFTFNIDPIGGCDDVDVVASIIINPLPNTGIPNNPPAFCENDSALSNTTFDLFTLLDAPVDSGGTWYDGSDITGTVITNSLDLSQLTIGIHNFTYGITDANTCSNSTTVIIVIDEAPESGTANTPVEFCEGAASTSFDLYSLITGESGTGVWTNNNTSTVVASPENLDLSGFTADTYDFTFNIDPIGGCDDVDVVASIIINPLPNTGIPNNPPAFCENDSALSNTAFDLFTLLDAPIDSGGIWDDTSLTPVSGVLSANVLDLSQLIVGTYNFTYSITDANGCSNSSTVIIIIDEAPESGTANTPVEFCEGTASTSFDLYSLITGESGTGVWTNNNTSTVVASPENLDLSGFTSDTYNFTFNIDPIGGCDDVDVVASIIINPLPNTGIPNNPSPFCENDSALSNTAFDLFTLLDAPLDSGGTWYDGSDTTGTVITNSLDLSQLIIGIHNFTYGITDANTCSNSTTVTITIDEAPESGTANAPIEFCLADITVAQTYNLFDLLADEDQIGTWFDDDSSLALSGAVVTLDGLAANTYNFTYDVDAIGTCDDVNVTVSIIINDTSAPTASSPQEFCDMPTVSNLVATGTAIQWYDAVSGGNLLSDTTALVDGQTYYATQTDATTGCESSVRTAVTTTIYISPNAGAANTTTIVSCNDNSSIDLFTGLDGTQDSGGLWTNDDGAGNLTGNVLDATGITAGTYQFTYLVTASSPCLDDSETIIVTIEEPLNAGSNINPTLDICSDVGTTDLFSLLGGADTGGIWSPTLTSTTGVFDPLVDAVGIYTYTLINSCSTLTNQVEVTVTEAPNAGSDNTLAICVGDDSTDLFDLLGTDAQSGGVWSPELTSITGVFDPAVDSSGTYTYTITAVAPCSPDSSAEIIVTVSDTPAVTVLDSDPEFCATDIPTVADLSMSISSTGTVNWYDDMALTLPLLTTDNLIDGEDYYATQTDGACESSIAVQINVTINDTPTPTFDNPTLDYCINDNPTISTLSSNIIEYDSDLDNLRWYDTATGGSALSESSLLTNTTYYVALVDQVTGCESSLRLEVIPDLTACGKLNIPDGFSPNGDGTNDTFDIDNLTFLYPNFEMEIYNRNGNVVYKGNANSPRFDGTSNQSRIVSKGDLPVGVYFYIFIFNDGENKPEQGRLYISR